MHTEREVINYRKITRAVVVPEKSQGLPSFLAKTSSSEVFIDSTQLVALQLFKKPFAIYTSRIIP